MYSLRRAARQSGAIGASPFNSSPTQRTEALRPIHQVLVAAAIGGNRERPLYAADRVNDDADMNVKLGVDPQKDL